MLLLPARPGHRPVRRRRLARALTPAEDRTRELAAALDAVEGRLAAACATAGRRRDELTLIAVSKTWPAADVAALAGLGVRDFGENRDQEAAAKAGELAPLGVCWHFVGQLQRNKARSVASYADLVHSVDRAELVAALAAGARRAVRTVGVCVQVALDDTPGRGGAAPSDVPRLADAVAAADGLSLEGVMAVAPLGVDPETAFARLAEVGAALRESHPEAVVVSAGMSADLEAAVAAGATHLRVGTALFGGRPPVLG